MTHSSNQGQPPEIAHLINKEKVQILVFSDTHGDSHWMMKTIKAHPQTDLILHLGDHESSLQTVMRKLNKPFLAVAGNCDWQAADYLPYVYFISLTGCEIFMTHGHRYHVKRGLQELREQLLTLTRMPQLVLFGHTHQAAIRKENINGQLITLANPGSASKRAASGKVSALLVQLETGQSAQMHLIQEDL